MSVNVAQQPDATVTNDPVRHLFTQYLFFLADLEKERERDREYLERARPDFDEFADWWASLDEELRRVVAEDFQKGYEKVLSEGVEQVAAVVEKYKQPV